MDQIHIVAYRVSRFFWVFLFVLICVDAKKRGKDTTNILNKQIFFHEKGFYVLCVTTQTVSFVILAAAE